MTSDRVLEDRWEVGSLFDATPVPPGSRGSGPPWEGCPVALTGSGRDALRLVLERVAPATAWVPSYLCQEVVGAVEACVPRTRVYADGPLDAGTEELPDMRSGDVVLSVAWFGVRGPRAFPDGVLVVEDHTHDPTGGWASSSRAHYCIASLRKLWPLPDGGVLWSPTGHDVPETPPVLAELERASGLKLAGMELKARYLRGEPIDKGLFRDLLQRGEEALYGTGSSGMTPYSRAVLDALPLQSLREGRRASFGRLIAGLPDVTGYRVLTPDDEGGDTGPVPFSAFVVFDDVVARDRVHRAMVDARVYASRLWPLDRPVVEGVRPSDVELSRRTFSVPIDMRYGPDDVDRTAGILGDALRRLL